MDTETNYSWVKFHETLATELLPFANKRQELVKQLRDSYERHGLKLPTWAPAGTVPTDVDPFTIFCSFCKMMTPANRMQYTRAVADVLGVSTELPTGFDGISLMNPMRAAFYGWEALQNGNKDIDNLWSLFEAAIRYADTGTPGSEEDFIRIYDTVTTQYAIKWNITMGLFWIRPRSFINLDQVCRKFLKENGFFQGKLPEIKKLPDGREYLGICKTCRELAGQEAFPYKSIPEISSAAWIDFHAEPDEELEQVLQEEEADNTDGNDTTYTKADFLREVFITEARYDQMAAALDYKYNIILRGAPGVGKSFAAKRLAYSLMGVRDDSRICMIQFHHSYAYEDFMQGYKPTGNGQFTLQDGIFLNFCHEAAKHGELTYYCIIDEINRGDLNKIFGEAFLLLEKDKRGTEVQLLYSQQKFTIPSNVRIIGMMNTADRSIALIDHALRRRFASIEMEPAFDTVAFKAAVADAPSPRLKALCSVMSALNLAIGDDSSLGKGYRIGHSYFCPADMAELTDERLRAIVDFEIVPLLEEYWFDEPDRVGEWTSKLHAALS